MPDYDKDKIEGCYLYYTSKCLVEAFHAHADLNRRRSSAAKFLFVRMVAVIYRTAAN